MNKHQKKMQQSWKGNTLRYVDPIGMTGRRPEKSEFEAIITDIQDKIDLISENVHSILDVGCNNGYLLANLKTQKPIKYGVDFCYEPLQQGQNICKDIQFIQAETTQLPFPDKTFNRILCYSVFHYLSDAQAGLLAASELLRILSDKGELLIGDIVTAEHKHLIPEEDKKRWNSPDRPYLHRMENWMFMPINLLKEHLESEGAEVEILSQNFDVRCSGHRFDIWVKKNIGTERRLG